MADNNEAVAEQMAEDLAQEVGEGFKSVSLDTLGSAWREAMRRAGKKGNFSPASRKALQKALRRKDIETYPSLGGKESHLAYRLYHKDNEDVEFLIDVITNLSEITDKMLREFLSRKEVTEVITVVRTVRGVS